MRIFHSTTEQVLFDTMYSSISVRKSTTPQNRQLNILISNSKQEVEIFLGGVDIVKLINEYIMWDKVMGTVKGVPHS